MVPSEININFWSISGRNNKGRTKPSAQKDKEFS